MRKDHIGFILKSSQINNEILIPKYYDPEIEDDLNSLSQTHNLITIQQLVEDNIISINSGHEIGKMAYGTGVIPFIRTSDISNWELKTDPKQGISEEIYNLYKDKQDVKANDILLVRDGTYLVGTSCILTEGDTTIVYCGGIYKIRVKNCTKMDPYFLFGLLNTSIVKKQIKSKQFTRDVIDTLGKRILELQLPIPKDKSLVFEISKKIKQLVYEKEKLRNEQKEIRKLVVDPMGKLSL
jgi:type I restriction enzyme M protein